MSAQHLEWNDLYLVLAVCREGTLSGAARVLGVNHSTVFRRIVAIEEKLAVRLFERFPTGYVMTEAGEAILESGERVENEVLGLSRKLVGRDFQLSGVLRVAVPDALLMKVLMPHFARFSKRYPNIQLEVEISNNYLNLTKREADIAVRATTLPPETLVGRKVCSLVSTLYGTTEYLAEQSNHHIDNYAWVMPDEALSNLPITKWLLKKNPNAKVMLRCNTLLGIHEAVRNNIGIASLPCFLADQDEQLQRVIAPPDELATELWLLTHQDLRRTARVRALMDFLAEALLIEKDLIEGRIPQV